MSLCGKDTYFVAMKDILQALMHFSKIRRVQKQDIRHFDSSWAVNLNNKCLPVKGVQERSRSDTMILSMVINRTKQTVIATHVELATTAHARRVGLLKYERLQPEYGLAFPARVWIPLMAIHTFGMRFPIDVLFLDRNNKVILHCTLPPDRIAWAWGARMVIEVSIGMIVHSGTCEGDTIAFQDDLFLAIQ